MAITALLGTIADSKRNRPLVADWTALILAWIRPRWHSPMALVAAILLAVVAWLLLAGQVNLQNVSLTEWSIAALIGVGVFLLWLLNRRIPRARRGTVGFVIAIAVYDPTVGKDLRQNFVDSLRQLLSESKARYRFDLVELADHQARRLLNRGNPAFYLAKSRSQFILWGRARKGDTPEGERHVLDLQSAVKHRSVPEQVQQAFQQEFSKLLPQHVTFASSASMTGFEITAGCIQIVAKYVIANASFLSGDIAYSRSLLEELDSIRDSVLRPPQERAVLRRLPQALARVYWELAQAEYRRWREDRQKERIGLIDDMLDRCEAKGGPQAVIAHTGAICAFVRGDILKAFSETRRAKSDVNDTWRLNLAFLYAYTGDVRNAKRQYMIARNGEISPGTPNQIEEFVLWVLGEDPSMVQLHYCLGIANLWFKGDPAQARIDLEQFLNATKESEFHTARVHAKQLLAEIEAGGSTALG